VARIEVQKPGPTKEDRGFLGKDNAKGIGEANPIRVTILILLSKTRHHGGFCGSIDQVANSVKFASSFIPMILWV
jgi:hypothetical protein